MNKQEYLDCLKKELSRLPEEEIEAALEYYSEYFDEAGPEREQQVLDELGSPAKAAAHIKADYAVRQLDEPGEKAGVKKGLRAILWSILGICAIPVALPGAVAIGAVAFAVFITVFAVVLSLIIGLISFCFSGLILIFVGVAGMSGSVAGGLLLVGTGLVCAGVTALMCVGVIIGAKALMRFASRKMRELRNYKRRGKVVHHE